MDAPADLAETDADGSPHALVRLLDRLSAVPEGERTSVADLMRGLGEASLLSLLLLPALVIVSPLSGIPMLPTLCGLAIALIAAQLMIGRDDIWLPEWLLRRSMDSARLRKALSWLKRPARWIDRITAHRLDLLVQGPARPLLLTACALAGLAMPFLELLPFTSSILAGAVTLIGLGLLVRDGVMALLGLGCIAGGLALILWLLRAVT
jgi:hypothetical protein